jgi:hypothetical protein
LHRVNRRVSNRVDWRRVIRFWNRCRHFSLHQNL